ncbi:Short-chain dehydrogenase [Venustampulla echinocandica]|uniref:3beta-hydroxysteroid 3-dehydrogenase n=1 Tax=Venustampulla echinocandica TaxID=2656787 RepID=A0A370TCS7_9HELO|nr:Short-chain dehydrogenase [Venustampulla echinocandica]RDL32069.1 Short-chain dehydrogenase [Venustampulla echinocandica]
MGGTILFTGANSSLAIPAVRHLLTNYSDYTALLTVRNPSEADVNTKKLRDTISLFPNAKTSIRQLDLSDLSAVHDFSSTVAAEIVDGKLPPLASIVCNAYYWNLSGNAELTKDGYDKTFQVNHLAHAALVLRLLGQFGSEGGRIVLLGSDAHWPGKGSLEKYPPAIPIDLELLVKPVQDKPTDNLGRGFEKYSNSKLAVIMWMYALNRHLENDTTLSKITAVAINPGNLSDSRALRTNTPQMLAYMSKFIISPLRPLLRLKDPTMRTAAEAGIDVVDLAMNKASPGERGYFTLLKKDSSSPDSNDEEKQKELWIKSAEWVKVTNDDTALKVALE